jgi:hypothetical protein
VLASITFEAHSSWKQFTLTRMGGAHLDIAGTLLDEEKAVVPLALVTT